MCVEVCGFDVLKLSLSLSIYFPISLFVRLLCIVCPRLSVILLVLSSSTLFVLSLLNRVVGLCWDETVFVSARFCLSVCPFLPVFFLSSCYSFIV